MSSAKLAVTTCGTLCFLFLLIAVLNLTVYFWTLILALTLWIAAAFGMALAGIGWTPALAAALTTTLVATLALAFSLAATA